MLLSELIARAQALLETHGDRPVVSGLDRSGWGEEVLDLVLTDANQVGTTTAETVIDIVLGENSTHEV